MSEIGLSARTHKYFVTKTPFDTATNNLPLLNELRKHGKLHFTGLSDGIRSPHVRPVGSPTYMGLDGEGATVTTDTTNAARTALWEWKNLFKEYSVPRTMLQLDSNKDHEAAAYLDSQIQANASSILSTLEASLYGDGTGSSGYAIDGLGNAVAIDPTVGEYGGIDRSVDSYWQNVSVDATTVPGTTGPTTVDNILDRVSYIISKLQSNGCTPTHIVLGNGWYTMFNSALRKIGYMQTVLQENYKDSRGIQALAGYRWLNYEGLTVINAGGLQRVDTGVGGMPDTGLAYVLDLNTIDLVYGVNKADMARIKGYVDEINKNGQGDGYCDVTDLFTLATPLLDDTGTMFHKDKNTPNYFSQVQFNGNFIVSDPRKQGVLYELSV